MKCNRCKHEKHEDEFEITRKGTRARNCKACVAYLNRPNFCRRCRLEFPEEEFKMGNRGKRITLCTRCDRVRGKNQKRWIAKMKVENIAMVESGEMKCLRCRKIQPLDAFRDDRGVVMKRCLVCREYMRTHAVKDRAAWDPEKRERRYAIANQQRRELRMEALRAYGAFCQCCGEEAFEFLAIDHVDGNGNDHRRKLKAGYLLGEEKVWGFYNWLRANNWPKGYGVLCHNCNMAKGLYGTCPHRKNPLLPVETKGLGPMEVKRSGGPRKMVN